jgi:hypothetical protein
MLEEGLFVMGTKYGIKTILFNKLGQRLKDKENFGSN